MIQLELFPKNETQILNEEIDKLKESVGNMRRGVFARLNELEKLILDLTKKEGIHGAVQNGNQISSV